MGPEGSGSSGLVGGGRGAHHDKGFSPAMDSKSGLPTIFEATLDGDNQRGMAGDEYSTQSGQTSMSKGYVELAISQTMICKFVSLHGNLHVLADLQNLAYRVREVALLVYRKAGGVSGQGWKGQLRFRSRGWRPAQRRYGTYTCCKLPCM